MHLRISTKRQGKQLYRYVQLVQSYRRADGMPSARVIASIGQRTPREIDNLRVAIQASREGKRVVIPEPAAEGSWRMRVLINYEYLDVAVALEIWDRSWKLSELFNRLIPQGLEAVPASSVVAALAIQRCVAPGSKLYAQTWYPKSALPELLGMAPEQFNNTRIHRVLEELDRVDAALQDALPARYESREGAFATLFMDVTDARFEGRGPEMAERGRTKDGMHNQRKVGIVLLCNERGYPLRWEVVPGKRRDAQCMEDMLETVRGAPWIGQAPLVCDRAMGRTTSISRLLASGVRFVTATARSDIESYTEAIPHAPFLELDPVGAEITAASEMAAARRVAEAAGLRRVDDFLYVLDLGVRERALVFERPALEVSGAIWDPDELEGGASFLALARLFQQRIDRGEARNRADLAAKEGLTRARVTQVMNALRLDLQLQERLLRGEFGYVPEHLMRQCAKLPGESEQRRLLEEHANAGTRRRVRVGPPVRTGRQRVSLRLVAYFNPQMFVEHLGALRRQRQKAEDFVAEINHGLRSVHSRREDDRVAAEVIEHLARNSLLRVFGVGVRHDGVREDGGSCQRVQLHLDEEAWARKRRYAGFVLLVAHPEIPHSAEQIVELYREKDAVEKDFQTIKDVVKLRPVYHHTDPKVRAHVTLCMLALLLERTIEHRLRRSSTPMSASECFEALRGCHLNLVHDDPAIEPYYVRTEPDQGMMAILRSLRMLDLVDPERVAELVVARPTA